MRYLLDTCVLSEFTRRAPNPRVLRWVDDQDEQDLFLSVITIGEIKKGIERLPSASPRKDTLAIWLGEGLVKRFVGRIFTISIEIMLLWGSLHASLEASGHLVSTMDSLIAATALANQALLVTRNEDHFRPTKVEIINPWH